MVYHVSATPGIRVLHPRVSTHGKPYVYAIHDLPTGLLFGVRHDDFDLQILTNDQGKTEAFECYPGAFQAVYGGRSCSVYTLNEEGFLTGKTNWTAELVCETGVSVLEELSVPDIFQKLLEEAALGHLILHTYENTSKYKAQISKHIADRLIRFDLVDTAHRDPRFQAHFKNLLAGLRAVMDGHLL